MTDSDIVLEVREFIEQGIDAGNVMDSGHIIQSVIATHPDIHGRDSDFYLCCGWEHVRDVVRSVIGKYKAKPEKDSRQLKLAGFEHLQKAYLIQRKKKNLIVPVEKCTDSELIEKANEYRRMAIGCNEHADELDRYRTGRGGSAAAA